MEPAADTLEPPSVAVRQRAGGALIAVRSFLSDPGNLLALVLLFALVTRAVWLWLPQGSLIFDEAYYVNSSRVLLSMDLPEGAHYADAESGLDPNAEHPPLGKVVIAASILVFGDGGVGWRLPSLIAGMVALLALYGIVRAAGGSARLGVLIVALLALDNLTLVHSRIGTLDMLALAPILVGAWLALRGNAILAGVALAIGTLVKLTSGFGLIAVLAIYLIDLLAQRRRDGHLDFADVRPMLLTLSAFIAVAVAGLWTLDLAFTPHADPWAHLLYMATYGAKLTAPDGPTGIASQPWQWLVNEVQINYLRVAVNVTSDGNVISSRPSVDFRGALNPFLIAPAVLAFGFALSYAMRTGNRLATWSLVWAAANYLPFVALVLVNQRIMYLYYFLPVVPALAVAVALLLRRSGLPRLVSIAAIGAMVIGFLAYFPFRQLP
ncbi:MAG: glycosyltransferase family 39 protein [Chloroflexota bacterium]